MPITKKTKIIIGSIAGFIVLTAGTIFGISIYRKKKDETPFVPDTKAETKAQTKATTLGKSKIVWRNDSLPLSLGSKGQKVKDLQNFLGVTPADGYLGYDTLTALKNKTGKDKVSNESEYATANPSATDTSHYPFKPAEKIFAKEKIEIYYKPESEYLLGHLNKLDTVGAYIAPSTVAGFSKVQMRTYIDTDGQIVTKAGTYFVPTKKLTNNINF